MQMSSILLLLCASAFTQTDVLATDVAVARPAQGDVDYYVGVDTFKVAVFEHKSYRQSEESKELSRGDALHVMKKNLDIYDEQAKQAQRQGAKLLVFPDNGLYGNGVLRKVLAPYLEYIPDPNDPEIEKEALCFTVQGNAPKNTEVQRRLSSMARETNLYIVATMADKKPCPLLKTYFTSDGNSTQKKIGEICPESGYYQFNTVVVYDPNGCLIARYHKKNLFFEKQFDMPPQTQEIWFDSFYGRFGVLAGFDVLNKEPAVALLDKHKVDHIIFPTAWKDQKPIYHAIALYSGYAIGNGVNVLSANIHLPGRGYTGSGIYTPEGAAAYTYEDDREPERLLVSQIPRKPRNMAKWTSPKPPLMGSYSGSVRDAAQDPNFYSWLYRDHYEFMQLRGMTGQLQACLHGFCCFLRYNISYYDPEEAYGFGVFSGKHTYQGTYFHQVCIVTKCKILQHPETCGDGVLSGNTLFNSLYIDATFQADRVWPQIVTNSSMGGIGLLPRREITFSSNPYSFVSIVNPSKPIISVSLVGRNFTRDSSSSLRSSFAPFVLSTALALVLLCSNRKV